MITYSLPPIPAREDVCVLICHRNTYDNIRLAVTSVMTHYPDLDVYVLDGMSTDYSRLWLKTREQIYPRLHVLDWTTGYNSHGAMMDAALRTMLSTPWVWILDSDVVIRKREELLLEGYANGTLMMQSRLKEGCAPAEGSDCVRYVHPSNMLLNREKYLKYRPFSDHGAPCIWNMIDADNAGEMTRQWGEILHLCGGSWTTPRTVWWHDNGVLLRPLLTVINGQPTHHDSDSVFVQDELPADIVMWEHPPTQSRRGFSTRMNVVGEYVCHESGDVDILASLIQQHGARDVIADRYVKRQVYQKWFGDGTERIFV